MTESEPRPAGSVGGGTQQPQTADLLRDMLLSPGYLKALVLCALVGVPVSLAAFWFLVGMHQLEHALWADIPHAWGWDVPPWWWPLPLLAVAGVCVGLIATRVPGAGGHVPASGLHVGGASPGALPGVLLAAVASLPFGAVLGPEAPLIALGSGLALIFRNLVRGAATPRSTALIGAAGAAAAIAAIFGNPLIAAVLLIEVAGVGGPQLFAVMLPALLSSGVGALVFTGFGRWTGLQTGSLALNLAAPFPRLDAPDLLWSLLMAVVIGAFLHLALGAGRLTAAFTSVRTFPRTVLCALAAAGCAALYALITDRAPDEVTSSGQGTLNAMAGNPHAWGIGALFAVLLFKGAAYALCLGSLRGGPIFPALFLGAAAGTLFSPLPGLGFVPAIAAGMAAAAASALRLPVSSVVLVSLLLGGSAMMPVVILSAVVAFVTTELLPPWPRKPTAAEPQLGPMEA
ncbi:chloride channel protein [Streptomyces sp. SPB162]|uniref:chloride channel protein n=1 Tax=Streptomyces sp. SPB162 TaxID=2940560 RepID=UPI002406C507|nr:chloride channel protein [Streptomyces sp. SPB162]MDF9816048.1 H+/Cl- antiporter ClcA [Streptomyces sp. SPB162]